jgi:hypothetical protein
MAKIWPSVGFQKFPFGREIFGITSIAIGIHFRMVRTRASGVDNT